MVLDALITNSRCSSGIFLETKNIGSINIVLFYTATLVVKSIICYFILACVLLSCSISCLMCFMVVLRSTVLLDSS